MQFNEAALENKRHYLDMILKNEEIVTQVLDRQLGAEWKIRNVPRVWEPGGGSTLFSIENNEKKYFLKVKHKSVTVESKLEEEDDFPEEPSLQNEHEMIRAVNESYCPRILFFDEEQGYQFLATEFIENSYVQMMEQADAEGVLNLWEQLEYAVHDLFRKGVVYGDLHENNIRCRTDGSLVLIDFEESRFFKQDVDFKESLDYVGYNKKSGLGEFPLFKQQNYKVHFNCLLRMKEVTGKFLLEKIPVLLRKCNYDSGNGICTVLDHGKSDLIYQSINTQAIKVKGQRGVSDNRLEILDIMVDSLFDHREFTFIDVGSNNGNFCRQVSKHTNGMARCIGLEGFHEFNILAKSVSYLENCNHIEFYDFLCGEDSLKKLKITNEAFMTVCSVYHHISNKDVFIGQIKNENIQYILFEMAVQEECYEGRTWEEELDRVMKEAVFEQKLLIAYSADYNRPMVLLAKKRIPEEKVQQLLNCIKKHDYKWKIKKKVIRIFSNKEM